MRDSGCRIRALPAVLLGLGLAVFVLASCGGGGRLPIGTTAGPVTTNISDPPTCGVSTGGPFTNIWVTITRVRANPASNADPSAGGWMDLIDLRSNPKQVDLLSLSSPTCTLTRLGSTTSLPTGSYQQLRLFLLSNNPGSSEATPSPNNCGPNLGFNCVGLPLPNGAVRTLPLLVSGEAQNGIKISAGQIAGGAIVLQGGQPADINLDFNACDSIVQQSDGQFSLSPTLTAGQVSGTSNSISGRVIDSSTGRPIPNAVVALEQLEASSGIDRVVTQVMTGFDGTFVFCPLPSGPNFDVVAAATTVPTVPPTTYNATITFRVPVGTAMGDVPLVPEPSGVTTPSSPATITGLVTTTTAAIGGTATSANIKMSALQQATPTGGTPVMITIASFAGSAPNIGTGNTTSGGGSCPSTTVRCNTYRLSVPASNPQVGTFSATGTGYGAPASGNVIYSVSARAFLPSGMNSGSADCSPSTQTLGPLTVTAGGTKTQDVAFTGCQ